MQLYCWPTDSQHFFTYKENHRDGGGYGVFFPHDLLVSPLHLWLKLEGLDPNYLGRKNIHV